MSRRVVLLLAITVAVLGIVALPSAAGLTTDEAGTTELVDLGNSEAAQSIDCSACHGDETPMANGGVTNPDTCAGCHGDLVTPFKQSAHGTPDSHAGPADCTTCHTAPEDSWFMHFRAGPHGDQNPGVSMAPEDTCAQAGCHGYGNEGEIPDGKEAGVTHTSKYHPEYGEWNETEDAGWTSEMVSHSEPTESFVRSEECSPCHGTHEGVFANIEDAPGIFEYAHDSQPAPEEVDEWRITCAACHEPHTIMEGGDTLRGDFEKGSELCGQCHNAEIGSELQAGGHTEVHHSMWEMYSRSKFFDASGSHPELECYNCHMASLDRPGHSDDAAARKMGHEFEVNTTRLMMEELWVEEDKKCYQCHQDLEATISDQHTIVSNQIETAASMREEANSTVYELELQDNEQLTSELQEGTFWLNFVEAAGSGIHNPEMSTERLRGAMERFDNVKSQAYQMKIDDLNEQLDQQSQEPQTTTTETPTDTTETTQTETPGLGIGVALVALLGAALLAVRRWT